MTRSLILGKIAVYYKECKTASIAFSHLPLLYLAYLSGLDDARWLSEANQYNVFVFLMIPLIVMKFKWLRDRIANNEKLAAFFEPFMVTWLLTSMWYTSIFSFSQAINAAPMFESTGSFFVLFFAIGLVVYSHKNIRPVFFVRFVESL